MSPVDAMPELALLRAGEARRAPAPPTAEKALRDFEAYFAGALLRQTSRSGLSSGLLDGGSAGRTYREMFYEELTKVALGRSGLGLAASLSDALEREPADPEVPR